MLQQSLQQIGLTEGEIKVYIALLSLGASTTWQITQKSGVSGSKVYEVLERLAKKGLVASMSKNGVKYFETTSPSRILDYLSEKQKVIEEEKQVAQKIIPELLLKQASANANEVKVFTGFEGIKSANEDIIDSLKKGDEWISMGLSHQPKNWERYFTNKQKERAQKGIKHRHLLNEKYIELYKQRKSLPHTEFRFLPKELEMPTSTEIYKDKVIIMLLLEESPMAIMIHSLHVASSFRKYFEVMWKISKK